MKQRLRSVLFSRTIASGLIQCLLFSFFSTYFSSASATDLQSFVSAQDLGFVATFRADGDNSDPQTLLSPFEECEIEESESEKKHDHCDDSLVLRASQSDALTDISESSLSHFKLRFHHRKSIPLFLLFHCWKSDLS